MASPRVKVVQLILLVGFIAQELAARFAWLSEQICPSRSGGGGDLPQGDDGQVYGVS